MKDIFLNHMVKIEVSVHIYETPVHIRKSLRVMAKIAIFLTDHIHLRCNNHLSIRSYIVKSQNGVLLSWWTYFFDIDFVWQHIGMVMGTCWPYQGHLGWKSKRERKMIPMQMVDLIDTESYQGASVTYKTPCPYYGTGRFA